MWKLENETRNDTVHEVLFGVPEDLQGFMEILIGTNVIHDDESNPIKKQRNHFTCINIERIRVCFRHSFLRHGACTRQFGRVQCKHCRLPWVATICSSFSPIRALKNSQGTDQYDHMSGSIGAGLSDDSECLQQQGESTLGNAALLSGLKLIALPTQFE